jgi:hypothetical protein
MCDEHDLIEENHTWSLADLPAGKIVVKWVYKLKGDAASNILKHKARLVAKGYVELPGIDIDEVFALVACLDSVRLLLAVAAQFKWEVHHMDLKTTFVNGELGEEVHICQPPRFVDGVNSSKVLCRGTPSWMPSWCHLGSHAASQSTQSMCEKGTRRCSMSMT